MHPTISYQLVRARTADLRQQALRDAAARAARAARRKRPEPRGRESLRCDPF
jgi:hypothetical protein